LSPASLSALEDVTGTALDLVDKRRRGVRGSGSADRVLVRDTKDRYGPVLRFGPAVWRRFADQVRTGV
jgi:hypothetical protein